MIVTLSILLLASFYLIGRAADLVITNTRLLGKNLGLKDFWLGVILGLLTTSPELFVGLQAVVRGEVGLSFGNLVGGIIVLLGFICGLSLIFNREIEVWRNFRSRDLLLVGVYLALPILLTYDQVLSWSDGVLLILFYGFIVWYFIQSNKKGFHTSLHLESATSNLRAVWQGVLGLIAIVVLARIILVIADEIMSALGFTPLLLGLLVFSLGTNLPELTLAFRSFQSQARDLSFGNLIGSAISNVLVLGFLALLRPFTISAGLAHIALAGCLVVLLVTFVWFAYTGRKLTRREGFALIGIYLAFIFSQVWLR